MFDSSLAVASVLSYVTMFIELGILGIHDGDLLTFGVMARRFKSHVPKSTFFLGA